jgi:hypothetical protein
MATRTSPSTRRPAQKRGRGRTRRAGATVIKHLCGHTQKHKLSRIPYKRAREVEQCRQRICTLCWALQAAEEAEAICGIESLPPLAGSVLQVPWGRSIRARALGQAQTQGSTLDWGLSLRGHQPASPKLLALAIPRALKKLSAKWWIDHREDLQEALDVFLPPKAREKLAELREVLTQPVIQVPF